MALSRFQVYTFTVDLRTEDLQTYSRLGKALWAEPRESERAMIETFAAASLLELTEDRRLERAVIALLDRASRAGAAANARANIESLDMPFFRLAPEERFILVLLHAGHWTYERVGRVLQIAGEDIEALAWQSRVQLAEGVAYPTGNTSRGPNCPEYDPARPWTQRFLDEEVRPQERVFLQNHMMACAGCREALGRCRDVYYRVDALLPKSETEDPLVSSLEQALARTRNLLRAPTVLGTFRVFLSRWEVQLALAFLLGLVLARFHR